MLLKKNNFISLVLAIISAVIIFLKSDAQNYSIQVLILFYFICIFCLYGVFKSIDQYNFSLNKTFYIFFFFFFGLAPAIQFKYGCAFFNAPILNEADYIKGGILLLGILIVYMLLYRTFYNFFHKKTIKNLLDVGKQEKVLGYYILSLGALFIVVILIKFNIEVLLFRPPAGTLKHATNFGVLGYSLLLIVRPIPIIILLRYLIIDKRELKHAIFLGLIVLIITFPTSLSRGLIAAYYIPFLVFIAPIKRIKNLYSIVYFAGVFLIFQVMNIFRSTNNELILGLESFKTGHFDGFQNFMLLVNEEIITEGKQLLGALLFFVQETTWANRPLGTGTMLATKLRFNHVNVAMPYFGEGYANFGYVGVLLFLVIIVVLNSYFDVNFHKKKLSFPLRILYLFLLGFEFYLLRGDLQSSVKKGASFVMALIIVFCYFEIIKWVHIRLNSIHKLDQ